MTENDDDDDHPSSPARPPSLTRIVQPFSMERERQPLTVDDGMAHDGNGSNGGADESLTPLFERVLQVIKASSSSSDGSITIRPARLAAELGDLSVNEACAELCGLMSAVGGGENGATFTFEKLSSNSSSSDDSKINNNNNNPVDVMVFTFPSDFEQRARAAQRRDSFRQVLQETAQVAVKVIKILTAFGLILSLLILTLAAMVGIVAAIVALSRDNRQHHSRNMLMRQLRTLFYTIRQLLWCFAVFGPHGTDEDGQDPFLREVSYDLFLVCSLCCGNPMSAWYWIRASQLSRRRRRATYGWGGQRQRLNMRPGEMESDVPGVTLVRRGAWANDNETDLGGSNARSSSGNAHRGLLSVAVEFLFGPMPFHPAPSEAQKWKLRAAVLVQQLSSSSSSSGRGTGVSMEEMSPYVDYPPHSLPSENNEDDKDGSRLLVSQALKIVAHFNGMPVVDAQRDDDEQHSSLVQTRFVFPELMAESTVALSLQDDKGSILGGGTDDDNDDDTWASLLYALESNNRIGGQRQREQDLPLYLHEYRYRFTLLTGQQLLHCVGLGSLNTIGVIMLGQSLAPGGVLYMGPSSSSWSWYLIHKMLLPILRFYAALFFVLPGVRLLWIVILNRRRRGRNQQRQALVQALLENSSQVPPTASAASTTTS